MGQYLVKELFGIILKYKLKIKKGVKFDNCDFFRSSLNVYCLIIFKLKLMYITKQSKEVSYDPSNKQANFANEIFQRFRWNQWKN